MNNFEYDIPNTADCRIEQQDFNDEVSELCWGSVQTAGIATGWTAEVRLPAGAKKNLFSTMSRPALRPIQPSTH
jgi:hypothetical protein